MMKKQDKNFKGKTHTKNLKLKESEIERPKQKHESKVMFGISYYCYYFCSICHVKHSNLSSTSSVSNKPQVVTSPFYHLFVVTHNLLV